MTITNNDNIFTDNTQDTNQNTIFVSSKHNEKFINKLSDVKKIIKDEELKDYFNFTNINIIGITGTNGKTTTAAAIYSLLLDLGYNVAFQGTRGFFINQNRIKEYSLTTPVQLEIFDNINNAIKEKCEYFIMEISSHAIVQNRICGLDFAIKIHTNITRDHLDFHKTIEEYIDVKNSFFNDNSVKLINKDDKNIKYILKNCLSYGLDNPSTYKVQAFSFKDETNVALNHFGNMYHFTTDLRGVFNIYNLTAAISATHILTKKPLQDICDLIDNFAGVSGRMQIISKKPFVVVDFAHTPDGMKAIFESFKDKDIICVFGAGGNRDKDKRAIIGKIASEYCNKIIITSDNPRDEDPDDIVNDILKGIKKDSKLHIDINRKEAIKTAIYECDDNSIVLVLGKGDEEYQIVYDKKLPFNDTNIIKDILNN